uniref:Uncharacterized protein n=1 Tax=Rhizophora mucronata TaxID=61149 RepID=A0A2P2KA69_RHIMU
MQRTAQAWFTGGPSLNDEQLKRPSSLVADWNAYAASQESGSSDLGYGLDLEAAVRTTSDKVSGTFSIGCLLHWDSLVPWWELYMFPWCFIVTFCLFSSLYYRFLHYHTMSFPTSLEDPLE